jgi:hypothetical protein
MNPNVMKIADIKAIAHEMSEKNESKNRAKNPSSSSSDWYIFVSRNIWNPESRKMKMPQRIGNTQ